MTTDNTKREARLTAGSLKSESALLHVRKILEILWAPQTHLADSELAKHIRIGPAGDCKFRGVLAARNRLAKVLRQARIAIPDLHKLIASEKLCCQRVQGPLNTRSNQAIKRSDEFGDSKVQLGPLEMCRLLHIECWHWVAGYPTKNAMHFEPGTQLLLTWARNGKLGCAVRAKAEAL